MIASLFLLIMLVVLGFVSLTTVACVWLIKRGSIAERNKIAAALEDTERALAQSKSLNADTVRRLESMTTYCAENAALAGPEDLDYIASELTVLRERVSANSRSVSLRNA